MVADLFEIISRVFPEATAARILEMQREVMRGAAAFSFRSNHLSRQTSHDGLPLFVCNCSLPGQIVKLHIFEPRYR
jgi:hypothetical protein